MNADEMSNLFVRIIMGDYLRSVAVTPVVQNPLPTQNRSIISLVLATTALLARLNEAWEVFSGIIAEAYTATTGRAGVTVAEMHLVPSQD